MRLAEGHHLFEKLVALSRDAIDGGDWSRAEAYLTPAGSMPGASEAELNRLRDVLVARKAEEAQRGAEARRRAREVTKRAARAMDEGEWNRAEVYLGLQGCAEGWLPRRAPEMPAWPLGGQADHGDVPRPAAAVAILEAAPTRALVRPGDTIEFYTRFSLVPPPGRPDAHVEATWVLKRDGRSLGRPGTTPAFAKAGIGYGAHPPGWDRSGALYGRASQSTPRTVGTAPARNCR